MRIAIYTDILPGSEKDWSGKDWFIYEIIEHFSKSHADCEFIVISNESFTESPFEGKNIRHLSLESSHDTRFSLYRLLNWKLPSALKKEQVDILLSLNGFLPVKSTSPSCITVQDIAFIEKAISGSGGKLSYLKNHFPEYLSRADSIAAISDHCKNKFMGAFNIPEEKITVVYKGIHGNFHPLSWEEREEVKNEMTDGREYFIYAGDISRDKNIIALLKGFSVLKKRLRSNMVLILAGKQDPGYEEFPELMQAYHFRDDVNRPGHLDKEKIAKLIGASYALVSPDGTKSFDSAALEALQCHVPVLAGLGSVTEEIAGEAGLYFNPSDPVDIGDKFCEIYKDEHLRSRLTSAAADRAGRFNWDKTISSLWDAMLNAMN